MPLTARLISPLALLRKLERESYRAFHAKTPLHKADHFFNFCVTAASMRDYTLEHLKKVSPADKKPYYDAWAKLPALVGAAEIANSTKHFVLRERGTGKPTAVKTRTVRMKKSAFVDLYANAAGETKVVRTLRTEVSVTLSDGQVLELYAFTEEILQYWKSFLTSLGFKVRRQPFRNLREGDA
jgi:hypothetical protein